MCMCCDDSGVILVCIYKVCVKIESNVYMCYDDTMLVIVCVRIESNLHVCFDDCVVYIYVLW